MLLTVSCVFLSVRS